MAEKLDGSAIVANTIPSNRIQASSITQTQLQPALYTTIVQATHPKIRSLTYPGNDTAANTGGGDTIVVNGTGFGNTGNVQIYINGNAVSSITVTNANSVSFTAPALSAATYPLYLINTSDGSTAILIPGIQYSGTPTWTTTTPLTTQQADTAWNIQLVATSDSAVSYSLQAGSSLPAGITLAANGLISGTMSSPPVDETTYNFTVVANDLEQQDASRAFSVSVTVSVLDPFFTYTTLLLHGDGTNNANNHAFVDSSTNNFAITRNGNATQGTFSPFGDNWSNFFDGSGDYLNIGSGSNNVALSGDFCIEAWVYRNSNADGTIIGNYNSSPNRGWSFRTYTSTNLYLYFQIDGGAETIYTTSSDSLPINQWNHVVWCRSGTNTSVFVNGLRIDNRTLSGTSTGNGGLSVSALSQSRGDINFNGYISNARVVNGNSVYDPAQTSIIVPTTPLSAIANTVLLTCQSNAFVDKGPNRFAITRNGDARVSKFDPFKPYKAIPASYGVYFDGAGDYLTVPDDANWNLTSSTGSYELFVYPVAAPSNTPGLIGQCPTTANWGTYLYSDGRIGIGIQGTSELAAAAGSLTVGAWNHIVFTRDNSDSRTRIFVNGVLKATGTGTYFNDSSAALHIGHFNNYSFNGHISNVRVCKGSIPSSYITSNTTVGTTIFTTPTSALTAVANTVLLACQSTTIIDNSTNAYTITRNGDARPTDLNPFTTTFVSEKYNTANGGGSLYCDGSGDSVFIANNSVFDMGSGNFTIEGWCYRTSTSPTYGAVCTKYEASGSSWWIGFNGTNWDVYTYYGAGSALTIYAGAAPALYQWINFALERNGSNIEFYVNGVRVAQVGAQTMRTSAANVAIGSGGTGYIAPYEFPGYISNIRIIKGNALYSDAYVPSITPVTNIANTSLLCNFTNAGIIDSVGKNVLETVGDARVNTSIKKFGTGSMYFDGNGDVLSIVDDEMHRLTSGDFTIECWVYPTANGALYDSGFASYGAASTLAGWFFGMSGTNTGGTLNRLIWSVNYSASGGAPVYGNAGLPLNTWTHAAVTKVGTTINLFINGVLDKFATVSATPTTSTSYKLYIGAASYDPTGTQRSLTGYIDDLRITKGIARYRYNFTPPTKAFNDGDGNLATPTSDVLVGDQVNTPVFPYTTLLLHGDGTNNANNHAFVDSSTNNFAITRNGNATQGTFSPFSPTGWSAYFDGSGDYVSFGDVLDIGSSNFTFECFVNFNSFASGSYNAIFSKYGADYQYQLLWDVANNRWFWNINSTVSGNSTVYYNDSLRVGEWYHLAFIKNGTSYSLYRNGVLIGTQTISGDIAGGTRPFTLGMTFGGSNNALYPFHGYISNFRALVGTILYSSNFTPPTTPLTAIANTQLLTVQSNRFIDNSTNAYSPTITGDTSIQAFSPFSPSVEYTANTHGGSAYFDGSGDYLTTASSANLAIGTSDFCIEFWLYSLNTNEITPFGQWATGNADWILQYRTGPNQFRFYYNSSNELSGNYTMVPNQWTHVAVCRSGTTMSLYVNGTRLATKTDSTSINNGRGLTIGVNPDGPIQQTTGYITDARIVVGSSIYTPSSATLTVPTTPLTAITNTKFLCNFTNAGILDSTGKNVLETVGDAKINTAIKKYGTGSMAFDGTGDYLLLPSTDLLAFGTGDYTIECWVYHTSVSGQQTYVGDTPGDTNGPYFYKDTNHKVGLYYSSQVLTGSTTIAVNTWYHVAVSRASGTVRLFVNGNQEASATDTTNLNIPIRYVGGDTFNVNLTGYIDDLRITKGIARYIYNFTPPTAAFLNK